MSFQQKCYLKIHITSVYENKRQFKCDICDSTFKSKKVLKRHNLLHEGKKLFNCVICESNFTTKDLMKQHIATFHIAKNPSKCKICDKSFVTKHSLKLHLSVHKIKMQHLWQKLCYQTHIKVTPFYCSWRKKAIQMQYVFLTKVFSPKTH